MEGLLLPFLLLAVVLPILAGAAATASQLGINYGTLSASLPPPQHSISLIKSIHTRSVKLYGTNPAILSALAGTPLHVSVMLPNDLIPSVAANQSFSDSWVASNLLPFLPALRLRFLLVGNEVFSDRSLQNSTWPSLVPAMLNLRRSLRTHRIPRRVKIGTPLAMDALATSFPPSSATFRPDIAAAFVAPLLHFLNKTRSFFFVDVYPYFVYAANSSAVSLDYALLNPSAPSYTDPLSRLVYTNLLDQQLDSLLSAMASLGYADVRLAIAETGWPNSGDNNEPGANVRNAAAYNRNLARKMARGGAAGTPARPTVRVPAFVFSLFNEELKSGPGTERHWGVFYANGTAVYGLDLTGTKPDDEFPALPAGN